MNQILIKKILKNAIIGISSGSVLIAKTNISKNTDNSISNSIENNTNTFKTNITQTNQQFFEVHSCSGKNICRGLGGCNVTDKQLIKQALKMGLDPKDRKRIGVPHGCYGLNECKGLGGCKVTQKKFDMMKKRKKFYEKKRKILLRKYIRKNQKMSSSSSNAPLKPVTNISNQSLSKTNAKKD